MGVAYQKFNFRILVGGTYQMYIIRDICGCDLSNVYY